MTSNDVTWTMINGKRQLCVDGDPYFEQRLENGSIDGRRQTLPPQKDNESAEQYLNRIHPQQLPQEAATAYLERTEKAAFDNNPRNCSGVVNEVLRTMVDPNTPSKDANAIIEHLEDKQSGWHEVTMEEASQLANQGKVVIAGKAEQHGHGHVMLIAPGDMHQAGGFLANGHMQKKTDKLYPPAVSGSLGSWAGSSSRGEKTVKDAWRDDEFKQVKFYTTDR